MQIVSLYRYIRDDGGVTVSIDKPECEYTEEYRLIADEEKMLTLDGKNLCGCVDVKSIEGWYEVDVPKDEHRMEEM